MRRLLALVIVLLTIVHRPSAIALAADYQQCTTSATCTLGEYLYDDDYSALTGATCTLTAKYPDDTSFLNGVAMTGAADGWYSYDATIGTTEGLYRATLCCTPSSGLMCLDKTFEVKDAPQAQLTAADVWSYSSRSLSTFGSLVTDVWGSSTRTLTSFGTLVADILGSSSSTTSTTTPSPGTLAAVIVEQNEQRALLEKLVNTPVISLTLGDGLSIPDLETKIDESKRQASTLYDNISAAKSRLMVLDTKWDRLDTSSAQKEITAVSLLFQDSSALEALSQSWDTTIISSLNLETKALKETLSLLLSATSLSKSAVAPSSLVTSLTHLQNLEDVLGDTTNSPSDSTVFGYLASVGQRNESLLGEGHKISALLENLSGQGQNLAQREITSIKDRLLSLNQYPGGSSLANPAKVHSDTRINLKNILYSLQALVGLNRQILAMNVGDPIRSLWLEEGSIIFRAVITNPSTIISQTVPLKFYLPRELKNEDILDIEPSLSTTYDSTEEALYASGTYNLKPGETKLVYVEVEDIWSLDDAQLLTLRNQAKDLLKPLEKTAYFSQGSILKSDIDVTLDKVALNTGKAITPENRIRTYREAMLELSKVTANMNRLQDLVAQASGTGSLFGFVGGVQTVAVFGVILVVIAGFIFLTIYFKKLGLTPNLDTMAPDTTQTAPVATHLSSLELPVHSSPRWVMPLIILLVVIITASSTIFLTRAAKPKTPPIINQIMTSPSPVASPSLSPTASPVRNDITVKSEKDVLGSQSATLFALDVPEDSSVNIRNAPESDADIIMAIKATQDVYVFKESGDWRQIGFTEADITKGYWVHSQFLTPLSSR